MAHDVFISHAHKDKSIADGICEKLESAQVKCWIAARDISASEDWTEATRKAIGSSRVMVLVLSENANAAPHIEREIAHAYYTRRTIIPIRLANTLPRRDFLFYLGSVRWFNAFNPSAKQHLAALTAHIKSLVPDRTATSNALPLHGARGTTMNSWTGALEASHHRTLGILKWVTIAACVILVVWLLCFAPWHTKEGMALVDSNLGSTSSRLGASPDSSPQARRDTSASKPTYTFTRFGLWEPPNTGPTPLAQPAPQDTPLMNTVEQLEGATSSPTPHVDQNAADKAEGLATQQGASAKSAQEDPARITTPRRAARLTSSWESQAPPVPPTGMPRAPDYHHQQYQSPDRNITWHSWQQLPAYEVRIRTGDRYLGGQNWAHYLGLELAATSQKVIKVSLIHLEGETAADMELSPTARDAIIKIVNHHMTAQKGAWGWTLQAEPPNTGLVALPQRGPQDTPSNMPAVQPASVTPSPQSNVDQRATGEAEEDPTAIATPGQAGRPTSSSESHRPPVPPTGMPPAPEYHRQQYQEPDRNITWHSWQQLPAADVRIRTGDHHLGGEKWAHYLELELARTSQKVIKVSLIHLEGQTAADMELSPAARDAIVKIVNHYATAEKGTWGWAFQEIKQSGP